MAGHVQGFTQGCSKISLFPLPSAKFGRFCTLLVALFQAIIHSTCISLKSKIYSGTNHDLLDIQQERLITENLLGSHSVILIENNENMNFM